MHDAEQAENLERVARKIEPLVWAFCKQLGVGGHFHAADLHDFVGDQVAPASADRILRHMRLKKTINYAVINRRQSLYQLTAIYGEPELEPELRPRRGFLY